MQQRGFTVIEILLAILVLTVGVVALVGSSALVTRMVGRGRTATLAAQIASQRLEQLRAAAAASTPPCASSAFASSTAPVMNQGMRETWTVPTTGATRTINVNVAYHVASGTRTEMVSTLIPCF